MKVPMGEFKQLDTVTTNGYEWSNLIAVTVREVLEGDDKMFDEPSYNVLYVKKNWLVEWVKRNTGYSCLETFFDEYNSEETESLEYEADEAQALAFVYSYRFDSWTQKYKPFYRSGKSRKELCDKEYGVDAHSFLSAFCTAPMTLEDWEGVIRLVVFSPQDSVTLEADGYPRSLVDWKDVGKVDYKGNFVAHIDILFALSRRCPGDMPETMIRWNNMKRESDIVHSPVQEEADELSPALTILSGFDAYTVADAMGNKTDEDSARAAYDALLEQAIKASQDAYYVKMGEVLRIAREMANDDEEEM